MQASRDRIPVIICFEADGSIHSNSIETFHAD